MQETNNKPELLGFVTYVDSTERGTAALVRNAVAATQHLTTHRGCEHTLIEIHSVQKVFVPNLYCRPAKKGPRPGGDNSGCYTDKAGYRPLLVLGNFNAAHTTWGYKFCSKRGTQLTNLMDQHNLALFNEPGTPRRMGTSTVRDTTPDLSLLAGILEAAW
ncbi:hypothetical protein HPB48_003238 [Haemaphysalis longicornis]|uniref:Endonuclease/exonuclease/phosphatase domain-containing protein n=1 Tax=Haemaphysalis longicornis TaxID=44386 RepID=A0A9J6H2N3_HAELO|nr:hypothetical protein HPB48_003238 [Haemaphysalis longicornis]